jgi:hypothetical protein
MRPDASALSRSESRKTAALGRCDRSWRQTVRCYLVDPYHLSNLGALSPARIVAHRLVNSVTRGPVNWIEEFSQLPPLEWSTPIDLLFIDGDHSRVGVNADWDLWTPHVSAEGHAALHDAREEADWTAPDWGPVQLLDRLRKEGDWVVVGEIDSLAVLRRR